MAETYIDAIRRALFEEMERDPLVYLVGEEVGHYQGAYKVSEGMLERFGEKRVIDAPITESGFTGISIGAAMVGLRPIVEYMTWNFSAVAFDQILNNAAKVRQMSGGQFTCPIVFRGPNGAARQTGAQHSQCYASWYAHVPGLSVVLPSTAYDAKGLLKTAIRDDNPVIFMEGETLYGLTGEVPDDEYTIPLGQGRIAREGKDITLVAWSRMVHVCTDAAKVLAERGIEAEVVDPRTLRPLDTAIIVDSVRKTGRCVIVEVGWPQAGFGGEIAYQVQRQCLDALDAPVERVCSDDVPMPYAKNLEDEVQPQVKDVVAAVRRALYLD